MEIIWYVVDFDGNNSNDDDGTNYNMTTDDDDSHGAGVDDTDDDDDVNDITMSKDEMDERIKWINMHNY